MYKTQRQRLTTTMALGIGPAEADAIIARAYGFKSFNYDLGVMTDPIAGLHMINEPSELLKRDPEHQKVEFIRMYMNLSLPGLASVTKGIDAKRLIETMFNFSNFNALITYAKSDPVDPHSADMAMLRKFEQRYGMKAPAQVLFGRAYGNHTYVIRDSFDAFQHYLDQELCMTNLSGVQVAIVRSNPDADKRLNLMATQPIVVRGELLENQSSLILGARTDESHFSLSIVPDRTYPLEQIVSTHLSCLSRGAPHGRSLIIDGVQLNSEPHAFDAGLKLAASRNVNVVIVGSKPDIRLWNMMETRLVFGFDQHKIEGSELSGMDLVLAQAATYVGRSGNKLTFVQHTEMGGTRYTAMDLTSEAVASNVVRRIFRRKLG